MTRKHRSWHAAAVVLATVFWLCWAARGAETFIITPGLGTDSSMDAVPPFAFEQTGATSVRYQQVYGAAEFQRELPQGGLITGLIFRADEQNDTWFTTVWPNVQIDMALTARGPDELSTVFAENIGGSLATVFPDSRLVFSSAGPGTPTSRIEFATPYFYHPADGNLLLQIRIFQPSDLPLDSHSRAKRLDAANNIFGPDTVSRVYAYDANANSGTADTVGLITFFVATPVPEPSTIALGLVAASVFGIRRLWRKTERSKD